ncbi:hypothetical protein FOZ63_006254, partial [Perkinsus olseni]
MLRGLGCEGSAACPLLGSARRAVQVSASAGLCARGADADPDMSEVHVRVLRILESIADETAFLKPPAKDDTSTQPQPQTLTCRPRRGSFAGQHLYTSEELAERTRSSLGWCQAHEAFRDHIIDSPHRFLDILNYLSELCQLLEVPTTDRSACRGDGMKSLGAMICLLVQQRFNATSTALQIQSPSSTVVEQEQEKLMKLHLAQFGTSG